MWALLNKSITIYNYSQKKCKEILDLSTKSIIETPTPKKKKKKNQYPYDFYLKDFDSINAHRQICESSTTCATGTQTAQNRCAINITKIGELII